MSGPSIILGLTGSVGSGCTTLSRGLAGRGFKRVSISDVIKAKFVEKHGKQPTFADFGPEWRAELQRIGNEGRQGKFVNGGSGNEDRAYWVKRALEPVQDSDKKVVVDGIRNFGEVKYLRERPHFWLVAVCADYASRWERMKQGASYPDERTFRRDDAVDSGEGNSYGQQVSQCVYAADYFFRNVKPVEPAHDREQVLSDRMSEDVAVMAQEDKRFQRILPY